ncbi:hypothetical protein CapIbe_021110 [Capra ibex]
MKSDSVLPHKNSEGSGVVLRVCKPPEGLAEAPLSPWRQRSVCRACAQPTAQGAPAAFRCEAVWPLEPCFEKSCLRASPDDKKAYQSFLFRNFSRLIDSLRKSSSLCVGFL